MICRTFPGRPRNAGIRALCLLAIFAISGFRPAPASGQESNAAAQPPNLRAALLQAAAPEEGLTLAVGADKVLLPRGAAMPGPQSPISQTATAFGQIMKRFGRITAVAPATMTVLNPDPGPANIYKNIPARQAFTFLVANLNAAQRQQLVSDQGLGMADLTTDLERNLFMALFPEGDLVVSPRLKPGQQPDPAAERDISDQLAQSHVRVGRAVEMIASTIGSDISGGVPKFTSPNGPHMYTYQVNRTFNNDVVDGVRIRTTLPNTPKKGELNLNAARMHTLVSLDQIKNVGELVARIATATGLELYADRHYEPRQLTLLGRETAAPAGDLLMALAYCLTGTYRRVGPAFVLTDDLPGVGVCRQRIYEMQADADAQRQGPLAEAEDLLQNTKAMWDRNSNWFGDPLAATAEQMKLRDDDIMGAGATTVLHVPSGQLTPPQQAVLEGFSEELARTAAAHPGQGAPGIDFNKPIDFFIQPSVQLIVPGLDGPVDTDLGQWVPDMFRDMSKWRVRNRPRPAAPSAPQAVSNGPDLSALIQPIARRALLAHPRTTQEIDTLVQQMQHLGLNELWLTVFSSDGARVPNSGLKFVATSQVEPDLLAYALEATRDKGIAVYAVCDLFAWGASTPTNLCDLTILGETSAQAEERRRKRTELVAAANGVSPPAPLKNALTVSPFAPGVQEKLTAFMKRLAGYRGLQGLVWRETDPSGYDVLWQSMAMEEHPQLGYTDTARLAFLRKAHMDPIDITWHRSYGELFERANTRLPIYDDWQMDAGLWQEWSQFRNAANLDLLKALYTAATGQQGGVAPAILLRERRHSFGVTWYGSWDGLEAPLPTHHNDFEAARQGDEMQRVAPEVKQAKLQSKQALVRLPISEGLDGGAIARQWEQAFKNIQHNEGWDGFVLEMGGAP
jgi:hypothetical protein